MLLYDSHQCSVNCILGWRSDCTRHTDVLADNVAYATILSYSQTKCMVRYSRSSAKFNNQARPSAVVPSSVSHDR